MSKQRLTVAETALFMRQASELWSDSDRADFIDFIAGHPEAGDVIPDMGGVRKLRWRRPGSGKRGGVRVIYFFYDATSPLYLMMVYAKASQENLTPDQKRRLQLVVNALKQDLRKKMS